MTVTELYNKLSKIILDGYGDLNIGIRHYKCDHRGPEEYEGYEWQNLLDIELVDDNLEYNKSTHKGIHLLFDEYDDLY